jgi:hypothetical protein
VFGDVTFAQAPFASLGGNTFSVSASETATADALFAVPSIVRGGILSETATGQDAFVSQAAMVATQSETATAAAQRRRQWLETQ